PPPPQADKHNARQARISPNGRKKVALNVFPAGMRLENFMSCPDQTCIAMPASYAQEKLMIKLRADFPVDHAHQWNAWRSL
ncbi:MAG TPA: hypothetical protein VF928_11415, partial [Usitatibacteraceae bacterium]